MRLRERVRESEREREGEDERVFLTNINGNNSSGHISQPRLFEVEETLKGEAPNPSK